MLSRRQAVSATPTLALPPFTQEDVLALIGWREEAREVVAWLKTDHFTQPGVGSVDYRTVAHEALSFWQNFASPPADHLYDLVLQKVPENGRGQWMQVLQGLKDLAPRLNLAYVTDRLRHYLHQADLKGRIYAALQALQSGEVDEAETLLSTKGKIQAKERALTLADTAALEQYLSRKEEDQFLAGIPDLDRWHIRPSRKTLYLVMAPAKRGKSWWLVHIGKFALMARARVAVITLEMPKEQYLQRFIQALAAASKRPERSGIRRTDLAKNESGQVRAIQWETVTDRPGLILESGKLEPTVVTKIQKLAQRMDLRIQDFPGGSLTCGQLESHLDSLEREESFIPDMVLIDYGDLMKTRPEYYRMDLRANFEGLRRIAQERNLSMVSATQTNRTAFKARNVGAEAAAEDFSKVMTADWILTFSQTEAEKRLGVGRIQATGRDELDGRMVVISQNFALGQFCLDSAVLPNDWEQILAPHTNTGEGDGEDR